MDRRERKRRIMLRRIYIGVFSLLFILAAAIIIFVLVSIFKGSGNTDSEIQSSSGISSVDDTSVQSDVSSQTEEKTEPGAGSAASLDTKYSKLLLVNGNNPLPENYDYGGNLTTMPQEYIKGSLTQIDKDVWPYLKAMLDDARAEGIDIGVWSPYRSYESQEQLYNAQVQREMNKGLDRAAAEKEAATVVARPGTSEHHTGLALDINSVQDSFKTTDAYKWLIENAEDYGFILRYAGDKQEITGVISEPWHWRFVGIDTAREINRLDMCLEEYVEYLEER